MTGVKGDTPSLDSSSSSSSAMEALNAPMIRIGLFWHMAQHISWESQKPTVL